MPVRDAADVVPIAITLSRMQEKISCDIEEMKNKMTTIADQMTEIDRKQEQMHGMVKSTIADQMREIDKKQEKMHDAVEKFTTAQHSIHCSLNCPSHYTGRARSTPPGLQ